jgi:hypothetical protein
VLLNSWRFVKGPCERIRKKNALMGVAVFNIAESFGFSNKDISK